MVRLREIQRMAAFSWSPGSGKPMLVTGTRAGAVDDNFSAESKLELWDLDVDNHDLQSQELQPVATLSVDSRFYDIAWGPSDSDHPAGIIAGALENGSLDLWDAKKLIDGHFEDALLSRTTKHSGAIKSLRFNKLKPHVLATGGMKGELFIYDVNDPESAFRLGTAAARSDDIECLAWNKKVSHILATGNAGGFVMVWDMKTKKASWTFNNNRKPVSAIAWDPNTPTKLLVATHDDSSPAINLWDLRNANTPERTLQGHEQGVLSLSWCSQDPELVLSCGKDNKTMVWNPQTGERYGEFPEFTNWTFLTSFNPHNPNIFATASFDGKIVVQTLQNTNPMANQASANAASDGEDFFQSTQAQPQGPSFSLVKAPSWLARPAGASFGFGGKLIVFRPMVAQPGQKRTSEVLISQFSADSDIGSATKKFEEAFEAGDISSICRSKAEQSRTESDKADWLVMEALVDAKPRERIITYLGIKPEEPSANGSGETTDEKLLGGAKNVMTNTKSKRLSTNFFGESGDGADGDDFMSNLAAAKGLKADTPYHLLSEGDTGVDKDISQALFLGDFEEATAICLKEDRMADAFLIANCGGPKLFEKVQSAYLAEKAGMPSYLRLLGAVLAKNLWDVVNNADLIDWKEAMAVLCTFSNPTEWSDLCEALGDRLMEHGSKKDASFCYLVGSKLEKVVDVWIADLNQAEREGLRESEGDSTFSIHARYLQQLVEKVAVFRHVTKFQDQEKGLPSGWKLTTLYDKYTEYADIAAAHGQLAVAQKYLDLLPNEYPAASVARNRIKLATQKAAPQVSVKQQPSVSTRISSRVGSQTLGYQAQVPATGMQAPPPYGASTPGTAAAPAVTPSITSSKNQYGPPSTLPYQPTGAAPYGAPQGYNHQPSRPPGAPYGGQSQYGAPPPSRPNDAGGWNDLPPMMSKVLPRKPMSNMAPITSPFPNQHNSGAPPPPSPYVHHRPTPTPPPPPRAGASPRVTSPPRQFQQQFQGPSRPSSAAASAYAPPPPSASVSASAMAPQMVPRTNSPYNAPPTGPPPSNRYAPAPAQQQTGAPPLQSAPPPGGMRLFPPNPSGQQGQFAPPGYVRAPESASLLGSSPYAPPTHGGSQPAMPSSYTPAASQSGMMPPPYKESTAGPTSGPAPGPPPAAAPTGTPPPPEAEAPSAKSKLPPGDRSQFTPEMSGIAEELEKAFKHVKQLAPASFAPQVKDTEKRLGLLFDHLNNEDLIMPDTISQLGQLANALKIGDYAEAHRLQVEIQTHKTNECGMWMVGVKRLINMRKIS